MRLHFGSASRFSVRIIAGLLLGVTGLCLAAISLSLHTQPVASGPMLRIDKFRVHPGTGAVTQIEAVSAPVVLPPNTPTFGQPVIAGIGGLGFEESIRLDPTDPNRIYTSAPGTASADTSWIWHSLDGGKTFKWVVGAAPLEGISSA